MIKDPFEFGGPLTVDEVTKAISWLARRAPLIAHAKAQMKFAEKLLLVEKSKGIKLSGARNAADREAFALVQEDYIECLNDYTDALEAYESLHNMQVAATHVIEAWASLARFHND